MNWVETDWRGYDAQLGRFHQVDKLVDKFVSINPYQYSFNNPVFFIDPSGLKPNVFTDALSKEWEKWWKEFRKNLGKGTLEKDNFSLTVTQNKTKGSLRYTLHHEKVTKYDDGLILTLNTIIGFDEDGNRLFAIMEEVEKYYVTTSNGSKMEYVTTTNNVFDKESWIDPRLSDFASILSMNAKMLKKDEVFSVMQAYDPSTGVYNVTGPLATLSGFVKRLTPLSIGLGLFNDVLKPLLDANKTMISLDAGKLKGRDEWQNKPSILWMTVERYERLHPTSSGLLGREGVLRTVNDINKDLLKQK